MDCDEEAEAEGHLVSSTSSSSVGDEARSDEETIYASDEESTTSEGSSSDYGKLIIDSQSGLGFGPLIKLPTKISRKMQDVLKEEMGIMLKDPSMIDSDSSGQEEGTRCIPPEVSHLPTPWPAAGLEDMTSADGGCESSNSSNSTEHSPPSPKRKRADASFSEDGFMEKKK